MMLDVARVPERNEQHERADAHCNSCAARKDPAETLDFAPCIGVERDGDFVVEFLDLLESATAHPKIESKMSDGPRCEDDIPLSPSPSAPA